MHSNKPKKVSRFKIYGKPEDKLNSTGAAETNPRDPFS